MESFDCVIVGAGPAGCVLAHRLSEDPRRRVLLLESGPPDNSPLIHMPKGIGKLREESRFMWWFDVHRTEDSPQRWHSWMRGRTLGGSSSINGMMYVRGQPSDYADLAALTSEDWNWRHIGAAFKAIEGHDLPAAATRGDSGPLRVTRYPGDGGGDALMKAMIAAGQALGLECQDDINQPDEKEKIGYTARTIHRGRRQSSAVAFLQPVRHRPNLVVRTGVHADRVVFEGRRAVAVECRVGGQAARFHGGKIFLCAGALASPAILQRSGVAAPDLLGRLGIPVVAESPEVGMNLLEQTLINHQWRAKGHSNNWRYRGLGALMSGAQYYLTHSGALSGATLEVTGHFKSRPELKRPDLQVSFGPHSFADSAQRGRRPETQHGFMICTFPLRPRARGKLLITSRDPAAYPKVVYDPFSNPDDCAEMIASTRLARKLVATSPLADFVVEETRPGPHLRSDADILSAWQRLWSPAFHAAGTCRMGRDERSVVDCGTRVRGVQDLHVVDLSISPIITAGNTYGPVTAMAWRAADLILNQLA